MAEKKLQTWKRTGKEMDKYQKGGYIIPDRRLIFDFELALRRGQGHVIRKGFTRADTIREAKTLVESVAHSLVNEEGWDGFEISMAA